MNIRILEAFSGIGSQIEALKRLNISISQSEIIEINKNAEIAYTLLHGKTKNHLDISKIDIYSLAECDLFTYSFPCTNISSLGNQAGFNQGSDTASSLLWHCKEIIEQKKPSYLLMENVKNILSAKHAPTLKKWINFLNNLGYHSKLVVLDGTMFDIPQIRNRVFLLSRLSSFKLTDTPTHSMIKKSTQGLDYYTLKAKNDFKCKSLDSILEQNVSDKYFLSEKAVARLIRSKNAIVTKHANKINPSTSIAIQKGYHKLEGRAQQYVWDQNKVRMFTPRECYRLMGWYDSQIDILLSSSLSNTQHYMLTGNSIIVPKLEYLFSNLLTI